MTEETPQIESNRDAALAARIGDLFSQPIDFAELLDEIAIGVLVLDLERKIVAINQPLKTLTGFSREELAGISCAYILRSNICLQNCPALNSGHAFGPKCIEGDLINRERQLIPIRLTSAPLKDIHGRMVGFLETVEDIRLLRQLNDKATQAYKFSNIVGRSPEMEKIFQILPSLAQTDSSILITGETGTGKDMTAEAIHQSSGRSKGAFVKVNCGALPETLLESELFGHRKGAFTGALENKPGRFRMAHNGTLYLTEIGDLPLTLQVKLLTFLDDKEVFPLGGTKGVSADVRIIAATHRNLERMADENRFRKDLMFRLNVIRLHLPPLRERQGDIQLLLDHFLNALATHLGKNKPTVSGKALHLLMTYHYPGNVRELRNIIEYALNICKGGEIKRKHLPLYLMEAARFDVGQPRPNPASPETVGNSHGFPNSQSTPRDWAAIEKEMIIQALVKTGGRKNKAAVALGWARSTLWRKMKQYGIQ